MLSVAETFPDTNSQIKCRIIFTSQAGVEGGGTAPTGIYQSYLSRGYPRGIPFQGLPPKMMLSLKLSELFEQLFNHPLSYSTGLFCF
jgi:hypothetical protein